VISPSLLSIIVDEFLDVGLDEVRTLARISLAVAVQTNGMALVFQCVM
jgi:hypothetical protein